MWIFKPPNEPFIINGTIILCFDLEDPFKTYYMFISKECDQLSCIVFLKETSSFCISFCHSSAYSPHEASCIKQGGSCIVNTTLALWCVWAHGLINVVFIGCLVPSMVSINWLGGFTILLSWVLFGKRFCGQLLGWEETSSCGKLFTPINSCENVSIMSFYKVKHVSSRMFGKVGDVDSGDGHWTKFKSRICPHVIATNGIGVGVNVIFFWKTLMLREGFGSFSIVMNESFACIGNSSKVTLHDMNIL